MDNQQVRLKQMLELRKKMITAQAWIAGMIDADGWIGFQSRVRKGKWATHDPAVDIASICPATIRILDETIRKLGCGCYVRKGNVGVRVVGLRRCKTLLEQVISFMVTKQLEAQLILEWCNSRLGHDKQTTYTKDELEILDNIKRMKSLRNLRDYTPIPYWLS